jgi:hypothetical protein
MRCAGHVACIGEMGTAYETFNGRVEQNKSLGRLRSRVEDNNKIDLKGMEMKVLLHSSGSG